MNVMKMSLVGVALVVLSLNLSISMGISAAEGVRSPTAQIQTPTTSNAPYVVRIKVSREGYILDGGNRPLEILELPKGPTEIVLLYNEKKEPLEHQFAISNNITGFYLQSELLSPNRQAIKVKLNVGANGEKEYDIFCSISCDPTAMMQLFKKIKVIG